MDTRPSNEGSLYQKVPKKLKGEDFSLHLHSRRVKKNQITPKKFNGLDSMIGDLVIIVKQLQSTKITSYCKGKRSDQIRSDKV